MHVDRVELVARGHHVIGEEVEDGVDNAGVVSGGHVLDEPFRELANGRVLVVGHDHRLHAIDELLNARGASEERLNVDDTAHVLYVGPVDDRANLLTRGARLGTERRAVKHLH